MKETTLLSVALKSRTGFGIIKQHLDLRARSREFQAVFAAIEDYYLRDGGAQQTDPAVVTAVVCNHLHNNKHKEKFAAFIAEAALIDVSVPNVAFMVLKAKREELGNKIALKLANDEDAMELIEEFRLLNSVDSLDALAASDAVVLEFKDVQAIVDDVVNNVGTLKLYPNALNDRLDGRLGPGHHVTYYGVPEIGKTGLSVTFSCGFCSQNQPGLYFINEDPERDIYMRHLSCMSGMPYAQIKDNPAKAIKIAESRGLENVKIIGLAPGNMKQIDAFVEKYDPKWVIIEQLINLNEKGDGLTQILGRAARGARTLAKRAGITVMDTCQGADSAAGKAVLDQGDVYMSNCLAKGELVRMYDGSVKAIQDIRVGELVMGMDNTPRTVLATGNGRAPLYRITHKNKDSYVVNEAHTLVIKNSDTYTRGEVPAKAVADVKLTAVLNKPYLLNYYKGIYAGRLEYPEKELLLEPYLFGLWLADGFSHTFSISTSDDQLKEYLETSYPNAISRIVNGNSWVVGFDQGGWQNPNNVKLKKLGVFKNKHIPSIYKTGSVRQRLKLLAGIIDGDGYLHKSGGSRSDTYRIATGHNLVLANDIKELATSLGFCASVTGPCLNGYSVYVAGPVTDVPCVLSRKVASTNSTIDYLASSIKIEKVTEDGEYYGITVDKDERYVLGNYIVTHNTEVPAQADLLIGIGGNADHIKNGIRILSLPKNKISGNHDPVTVKIHEAISRYSSHD